MILRLRWLVLGGCRGNVAVLQMGRTAVMVAAANDSTGVAKMLVEKGADKEVKTKVGVRSRE